MARTVLNEEELVNQRKKNITQARDILAAHATYTFTDDERNMIECACGWQSSPFLPEPLMKASEVLAVHQTNELLKAGLL